MFRVSLLSYIHHFLVQITTLNRNMQAKMAPNIEISSKFTIF